MAIASCSLRRGARQEIIDPETGDRVRIFNPRRQDWGEHFCWDGVRVMGLTVVGRAR